MSSQDSPSSMNSQESNFPAASDSSQELTLKVDSTNDGSPEVDKIQKTLRDAADPTAVIATYRTRFWILGLFTYESFLMIIVWITFGPIMESAEYAFGWDDGYIALLDGFGTIFCLVCTVPLNWTAQKYGLRVAALICSSLIAIGSIIRCLSTDDTAITYLAGAAAILVGAATPLTLPLASVVAATWFPKNERATATALCEASQVLGIAISYLSPLIVRSPDGVLSPDDIKGDIRTLLYIICGLAVFGWICVVLYYPKKPPHPPSASATKERINYYESVKIVAKSPQIITVIITFALINAIPIAWVPVMDFSFSCLDISQDENMWIGFSACVVAPIVSILVARMTDRFYGHLKHTVIGLLVVASCSFLWFLLITEKVIIISSIAQPLVAVVLGISCQLACVPLLIELAVEMAYPCPESVIGAGFSIMMNLASSIFLLLMMINSQCYKWLSYVVLGTASLTIIPLALIKETHPRSNLDSSKIKNGENDVKLQVQRGSRQ